MTPAGKGGRDRGSEGAPNPPYANPTLRRRRTGDTGPRAPGRRSASPEPPRGSTRTWRRSPRSWTPCHPSASRAPGLYPVGSGRRRAARGRNSAPIPETRLRCTPAWRASRPSPPPGPDRAPPRFPGGSPCAAQPGDHPRPAARRPGCTARQRSPRAREGGESASKTATALPQSARAPRDHHRSSSRGRSSPNQTCFAAAKGQHRLLFSRSSLRKPPPPPPSPPSVPPRRARRRAPRPRFRRDFFLGRVPRVSLGVVAAAAPSPLQERQRLRLQARAERRTSLLYLLQRHLPTFARSRNRSRRRGPRRRPGRRRAATPRDPPRRRFRVRPAAASRLWVASSGTKRRRFPRGRSQAGPPPDSARPGPRPPRVRDAPRGPP